MPTASEDVQPELLPAASHSSKAEQLARTRRNQQRCRERKRAHVAELESQVTALQAKIRECEPCGSPNAPEHESALDEARRENAARRDLLLALGFDDETQQRFIQSTAKRQAVYSILQGDGDADDGLTTSLSTSLSKVQVQSARPTADFAPLQLSTDHALDSIHPDDATTNINVNAPSNVLDPSIEDWLLPLNAFDRVLPSSITPSSGASWLPGPHHNHGSFGQKAANAVETTNVPIQRGFVPNFSAMGDSVNNMLPEPVRTESYPTVEPPSIKSCFLYTVVNLQPAESSTVCSVALSLIFRHNRKGLSMAELQKKLEPGMIAAFGTSRECRIEDGVLFQVLADIYTLEPQHRSPSTMLS